MQDLNWLAVFVAALGSFLLGGPWYSPALFGGIWIREANDQRPAGPAHPPRVFVISFAFSLVAAGAFAYWLGPKPTLPSALGHGLLAGAGLVATSFGINYQFASRSMLMWLVDAGYHTVQFLLFGLVLGLWH